MVIDAIFFPDARGAGGVGHHFANPEILHEDFRDFGFSGCGGASKENHGNHYARFAAPFLGDQSAESPEL